MRICEYRSEGETNGHRRMDEGNWVEEEMEAWVVEIRYRESWGKRSVTSGGRQSLRHACDLGSEEAITLGES